jgi:hypothetical protein
LDQPDPTDAPWYIESEDPKHDPAVEVSEIAQRLTRESTRDDVGIKSCATEHAYAPGPGSRRGGSMRRAGVPAGRCCAWAAPRRPLRLALVEERLGLGEQLALALALRLQALDLVTQKLGFLE